MSADPPVPGADYFRHWITDIEISPDNTDPSCKFSAKIFVDDELACSLPWIEHTRPLRWSGLLLCNVLSQSKITLRLCRSVKDKTRYFNFPVVGISEIDQETGDLIQELPDAVWLSTIKSLTLEVAAQLFPQNIDTVNGIQNKNDALELDETEIIKSHFKDVMHFAKAIAEACPESTAKVSFTIYMKAWEVLDKQTQIDDMVRSILRGLIRIHDIVEIIRQASSSMLATALNQSKELIQDILVLLEDISVSVFNRYGANDLADIPSGELEVNEGSYVEAYLARLEDLQKRFYVSWSAATISCADTTDVADDEPLDAPPQDIQPTIDESTKMTDLHEILSLLKPLNPSGYNPDRACLDGTCEPILNRIFTWTQNRQNRESIMWISGQPGTGKTSVATSLCQRLDSIQALAGSFFCQRDNSNRSTPLNIINNLVCDIAMNCPSYAHEVAKAIRMTPKLHNAHISLRFEGLVKKPLERLKSLKMPTSLVVVVDALDECGDCESRERVLQKLYEMSRLVPWLKLIFTARPTGDIQEYFQAHCTSGTVVQMQAYDASSDITTYIEGRLGRLARIESWPHNSIAKLCNMAQGVFLWAVLVSRYITNSPLPALSRLRRILDNQQSPVSDHFDKLYTQILEAILHDHDQETRDAYFRCIGLILATSKGGLLSSSDLQGILLIASGINQTTLERVIKGLGPLICVKDGRQANFHHSYFRDYITNPSRSDKFFIQPDQSESECTESCFKLMGRNLKFNICGLDTSHLRNSEVPDLKLRTQAYIGPTLQYACAHWPSHFATSPNQKLVLLVKEFLKGPQLMYWLEVLSLLGRLDLGLEGLSKLASLELKFDEWDLLVSWARDAHRFLLSFHDPIAASAPHLYVSALAFAPSESCTAQRMRPFFPNTIKVADGDKDWHSCIRSVLHPQAIQALSISPDGSKHVVGYSDGSLRIWDNQTGDCTSELLVGHEDSVTCVTFSSSGGLIASGSLDTTIRVLVWDSTDGLKTRHTLSGHSASVNSVAFSPNNAIIASGSSDKTIRLWDSKALCSIGEPYLGHSSRVSSLAFSPDGSKLASASWDKTIRIWSVDPIDSRLSSNPLVITGHSDSITCVAFSPEGSKIASGSVDRTVQTWDAQTGGKAKTCVSLIKHSDSISAIAFSPDGKSIASSSLDGAVQLWNATTFIALGSFGHFSPVNTIAFAPGSTHDYLISGATDSTTRVWDITKLIAPLPMTVGPIAGHSSVVRSIAISNDGTRIISGSHDKTVRVWDAQTSSPIGQPFVGHSGDVNCVAISSDTTRILSASNDKTMKLWDIAACTTIQSYQHESIIRCVAFSPNSDLIAFGSDDSKVYPWEPIEWRIVKELQGQASGYVASIAFSLDGTRLASAGHDKTIILWDVKTHNRQGVPFSDHTDVVTSVAFSACGTRLVSGADDKTVRLWDIKSGNVIRVMSGHSTYVTTVAFSHDGAYIASGSWDNTIRVWNTETGQMIGQPLSDHSGYVWSVVFSRDGKYIISSSADKTIRVWSLDTPTSTPTHVSNSDSPGGFRWPANPYKLTCHPYSGWATDCQKSLIFWLPAHYEQSDQFMSAATQASRSQPHFDYSNFVHGTAWAGVARDPVGQT